MTDQTPRTLIAFGVIAWAALVLLGIVQWLVFGEEWTRGYLDFLAIMAAAAIAWRMWR